MIAEKNRNFKRTFVLPAETWPSQELLQAWERGQSGNAVQVLSVGRLRSALCNREDSVPRSHAVKAKQIDSNRMKLNFITAPL